MQNYQTLLPVSYPARLHVVFKYLGLIFIISAVLVLVPLIASLLWQEYSVSLRYALVCACLLIVGLPTLAIARPNQLQPNEAYSVIALSFIAGSFAMVYPMMGVGLNFIDALFESISGLTTTGLSVANLSEIEPKTFFFARSWMQWYGGLGIIVFSLSLAFLPGTVSKTFIKQVAYKDDRIENSKVFARKILIIYTIITLLGIVALKVGGLGWIVATEFTFCAISTGGFSPYIDSLGSIEVPLQALVIFLGFLGSLSFPLYWITNLKCVKQLFKDVQVRGLIACIIFFSLFIFLIEERGFLEALLNVISAQTTMGFSTFDLTGLSDGSKFLLLSSMFIGGGTLSSAGGLKILRVLIIFQALRLLFMRTSLTKSSFVSKEGLPEAVSCLCVFALYILVIFFSTLAFVIMGYPAIDSLFDVVSATSTVGISSGVSVGELPTILKIILGFDMLLGRLEVVTLLVLFYPRTLIGRRIKT